MHASVTKIDSDIVTATTMVHIFSLFFAVDVSPQRHCV